MSKQTSQLRICLRDPIPEIFDATRYLDAATSAHLAGRAALADELIRMADFRIQPARIRPDAIMKETSQTLAPASDPYSKNSRQCISQ